MTAVRPVILCGGIGARLWPISRRGFPKHLARFSEQQSLFQDTVLRVQNPTFSDPLLVASEEQRAAIESQMAEAGVSPECVILERSGRNTAPAIALAAEWLALRDPAELMLVLPSDHKIEDDRQFALAITEGVSAAEAGRLVTYGISPRSPETGFGYIKVDRERPETPSVLRVVEFVEKPSRDRAEAYLASGDYLWNAGIFLFRARSFLDELAEYAPEISKWAKRAVESGEVESGYFRPGETPRNPCPSISVDYAVMEKSRNVSVVPTDLRWSDLGSWNEVWTHSAHDVNGNAILGNVVTIDTQGSLVFGYDDMTVATIGVHDMVVVATGNAVLVLPKERAQEVRQIVEALDERQRRP